MELCPYGSVLGLMERRDVMLTEPQIAHVLLSCLKALAYLHISRKLVHRWVLPGCTTDGLTDCWLAGCAEMSRPAICLSGATTW
jgi:hypothetical protein